MRESILKDTGLTKRRLLAGILGSPDICGLLLDKTDAAEDECRNLMYTQVFPYLNADGANLEVSSYICIEAGISKMPTGTIKEIQLIVWACCDKNNMQYTKEGYEGTRVDILTDMLERQIRSQDKSGIGKPSLQTVKHIFPNDRYYGKELIFTASDFRIKG